MSRGPRAGGPKTSSVGAFADAASGRSSANDERPVGADDSDARDDRAVGPWPSPSDRDCTWNAMSEPRCGDRGLACSAAGGRGSVGSFGEPAVGFTASVDMLATACTRTARD